MFGDKSVMLIHFWVTNLDNVNFICTMFVLTVEEVIFLLILFILASLMAWSNLLAWNVVVSLARGVKGFFSRTLGNISFALLIRIHSRDQKYCLFNCFVSPRKYVVHNVLQFVIMFLSTCSWRRRFVYMKKKEFECGHEYYFTGSLNPCLTVLRFQYIFETRK